MQTLIGALVAPSHGYDNLRFDQLRVIIFHAGKSSKSFETFQARVARSQILRRTPSLVFLRADVF